VIAAIGCRAHTGWAAVVVVAGDVERPAVLLRERVELADPSGRVRPNAYQAARNMRPEEAAVLIEAAERIGVDRATSALEHVASEVAHEDGALCHCAIVVGAFRDPPLESILASHALAHAAEGRLYQTALLRGAAASGLEVFTVPKQSIWEEGESAFGTPREELKSRIDEMRREIGPPWAEDQKLAALAAWIALARKPIADG
jgi:NTP pyrophosphatase (non-canonical NTP hydrolase)